MHVTVTDPDSLLDLRAFLRECGCAVVSVGRREAHVVAPWARDADSAREEVGLYLAAWRVKSGVTAELVD
jgi:hypothetical protein